MKYGEINSFTDKQMSQRDKKVKEIAKDLENDGYNVFAHRINKFDNPKPYR